MALSQKTRNQLRIALCSSGMADTFADAIDSGGSTISAPIRRAMSVAVNSPTIGNRICDAAEDGTALDTEDIRPLAFALGSYPSALEIRDELAA